MKVHCHQEYVLDRAKVLKGVVLDGDTGEAGKTVIEDDAGCRRWWPMQPEGSGGRGSSRGAASIVRHLLAWWRLRRSHLMHRTNHLVYIFSLNNQAVRSVRISARYSGLSSVVLQPLTTKNNADRGP